MRSQSGGPALEAEVVGVDPHEVSVTSLINDLKADYKMPIEKDITFSWRFPPSLPVLKTDYGKLKLIMQNLINNAIKFTEQGEVTITAEYAQITNAIEFKVSTEDALGQDKGGGFLQVLASEE